MRAEAYLARGHKVEQATKIVAELRAELWVPPFPIALAYIWRAYMRLRRRKSMGFNGYDKIEWPDIDAFLRRSGVRLLPWEVEIVEDIDDIFCREMAHGREATEAEAAQAAKESVTNTAKRSRTVRRERGGP